MKTVTSTFVRLHALAWDLGAATRYPCRVIAPGSAQVLAPGMGRLASALSQALPTTAGQRARNRTCCTSLVESVRSL